MMGLYGAINRRWICRIVNIATGHNGNRSRLRISGIRGIYPHNINISSGDDSWGSWSNDSSVLSNKNVAWTITIAVVPPENEQKHDD